MMAVVMAVVVLDLGVPGLEWALLSWRPSGNCCVPLDEGSVTLAGGGLGSVARAGGGLGSVARAGGGLGSATSSPQCDLLLSKVSPETRRPVFSTESFGELVHLTSEGNAVATEGNAVASICSGLFASGICFGLLGPSSCF